MKEAARNIEKEFNKAARVGATLSDKFLREMGTGRDLSAELHATQNRMRQTLAEKQARLGAAIDAGRDTIGRNKKPIADAIEEVRKLERAYASLVKQVTAYDTVLHSLDTKISRLKAQAGGPNRWLEEARGMRSQSQHAPVGAELGDTLNYFTQLEQDARRRASSLRGVLTKVSNGTVNRTPAELIAMRAALENYQAAAITSAEKVAATERRLARQAELENKKLAADDAQRLNTKLRTEQAVEKAITEAHREGVAERKRIDKAARAEEEAERRRGSAQQRQNAADARAEAELLRNAQAQSRYARYQTAAGAVAAARTGSGTLGSSKDIYEMRRNLLEGARAVPNNPAEALKMGITDLMGFRMGVQDQARWLKAQQAQAERFEQAPFLSRVFYRAVGRMPTGREEGNLGINHEMASANMAVNKFGGLFGLGLYGSGMVGASAMFVKSNVEAAMVAEKTKVVLGGLINTYMQFRDEQGKNVSAQENFNRSMRMSARLYEDIRTASYETMLTQKQLTKYFSTTAGFGFKAGLNEKQVLRVNEVLGTLGVALDLPDRQIEHNIRDLFRPGASIGNKTAILTMLGFKKEERDKAIAQGPDQFMAYFNEKLKGLDPALQELLSGFNVKWTTFLAHIRRMQEKIGGVFIGSFGPLIDDFSKKIDEFVSSGRAERFAKSFGNLLSNVGEALLKFADVVSTLVENTLNTALTVLGVLMAKIVWTIGTNLIEKLGVVQSGMTSAVGGLLGVLGVLITGILLEADRAREANKTEEQKTLELNRQLTSPSAADDKKMKDAATESLREATSGSAPFIEALRGKADVDLAVGAGGQAAKRFAEQREYIYSRFTQMVKEKNEEATQDYQKRLQMNKQWLGYTPSKKEMPPPEPLVPISKEEFYKHLGGAGSSSFAGLITFMENYFGTDLHTFSGGGDLQKWIEEAGRERQGDQKDIDAALAAMGKGGYQYTEGLSKAAKQFRDAINKKYGKGAAAKLLQGDFSQLQAILHKRDTGGVLSEAEKDLVARVDYGVSKIDKPVSPIPGEGEEQKEKGEWGSIALHKDLGAYETRAADAQSAVEHEKNVLARLARSEKAERNPLEMLRQVQQLKAILAAERRLADAKFKLGVAQIPDYQTTFGGALVGSDLKGRTDALRQRILNKFPDTRIEQFSGKPRTVTVPGSKTPSAHNTGMALDVYDPSQEKLDWLLEQPGVDFVLWNGKEWRKGKRAVDAKGDPHTTHMHVQVTGVQAFIEGHPQKDTFRLQVKNHLADAATKVAKLRAQHGENYQKAVDEYNKAVATLGDEIDSAVRGGQLFKDELGSTNAEAALRLAGVGVNAEDFTARRAIAARRNKLSLRKLDNALWAKAIVTKRDKNGVPIDGSIDYDETLRRYSMFKKGQGQEGREYVNALTTQQGDYAFEVAQLNNEYAEYQNSKLFAREQAGAVNEVALTGEDYARQLERGHLMGGSLKLFDLATQRERLEKSLKAQEDQYVKSKTSGATDEFLASMREHIKALQDSIDANKKNTEAVERNTLVAMSEVERRYKQDYDYAMGNVPTRTERALQGLEAQFDQTYGSMSNEELAAQVTTKGLLPAGSPLLGNRDAMLKVLQGSMYRSNAKTLRQTRAGDTIDALAVAGISTFLQTRHVGSAIEAFAKGIGSDAKDKAIQRLLRGRAGFQKAVLDANGNPVYDAQGNPVMHFDAQGMEATAAGLGASYFVDNMLRKNSYASEGGEIGGLLASTYMKGLGPWGAVVGTLGGGLLGSLFGKRSEPDPNDEAYRRNVQKFLASIDRKLSPVHDYYQKRVALYGDESAYLGGRLVGYGQVAGAH